MMIINNIYKNLLCAGHCIKELTGILDSTITQPCKEGQVFPASCIGETQWASAGYRETRYK